jgi:hypothetical protein
MGGGAITFRNTIREIAAKGQKKVVLNLPDLSYV